MFTINGVGSGGFGFRAVCRISVVDRGWEVGKAHEDLVQF